MGQILSNKKPKVEQEKPARDEFSPQEYNDDHPGCVSTLRGHTGPIFCVSVINPTLVVSGSEDWTVGVWVKEDEIDDTETEAGEKQQWHCAHVLEGHKGSVTCLTHFSLGGDDFIVSGGLDDIIKVWQIAKDLQVAPTCVATWAAHGDFVFSLSCYRPTNEDGDRSIRLISGSNEMSIKLWQLKDDGKKDQQWECYKTLEGHEEGVRCLLVLPNRRVLASGAYDNTVRLWDLETGQCLHVLQGHTGIILLTPIAAKNNNIVDGVLCLCTLLSPLSELGFVLVCHSFYKM